MTGRAMPEFGQPGLVLAVHGIRGGPGFASLHRETLAGRGLFRCVEVGCHKGAPDLVEVVKSVAARGPVVIAPLLMAAGYTLRAIQRRLDEGLAPHPRPPMSRPLGVHPRFADLILNEALLGCARRGWDPGASGMLLVGHGTGRDPTSGGTTRRHAATVMATGHFAQVGIAFLDEPPAVPDALARFDCPHVVVVGLFLDRGEHGEADIPALLAGAGDRADYTGPLGVDPLVPDLVLDQLRALRSDAAA